MTNCATHSEPKAATLASSTATVRPKAWKPMFVAHRAARLTNTVDRPRPANDIATNGTTWRETERSPVSPQTHRRFSSNEGTVPIAVATTLAQPAGRVLVATNSPSTARLVVVAIADTAP